MTHAVYYRNAHAHEILLKPNTLTWRTLGGNIDLYFYAGVYLPEQFSDQVYSNNRILKGPTIEAAATSYQSSTIGLPAMQQYWTFGLFLDA